MFLPIHDRNPLKVIPFQFVNVGFLISFLGIFLLELSNEAVLVNFSLIPAVFFGHQTETGIPSFFTPFTYIFLHAGWWHLISNMLYLWVFGDNIEDEMGHGRYFIFFLLCGAIAGVAQAIIVPESGNYIVGASGAISGVLGAYLLLHPKVKVLIIALKFIPLQIPARWLLLTWIGLQVTFAFLSEGVGVAWWAHIAGFIAGMILIIFFRRKQQPLLDSGVEH